MAESDGKRVTKMKRAAPSDDKLKKPQERWRREARRMAIKLRRMKNRRY